MTKAPFVTVQYACSRAGLPERARIAGWAGAVLEGRREQFDLTVRIVGEAEGAELNERWRRGRGATNVLSFSIEGLDRVAPAALGDIAICAPVAVREAREQGKMLDAHFAHLVIHGVLHLLGFDHQEDREAEVMEALERRYLVGLGYSDPYALGGQS